MKYLLPAAWFVSWVAWVCGSAAAEIIPAERKADWRPGVTVGVPGGIPANRTNLIDVTKSPYEADPTGAADAQPAIIKAVAKAAENDVVYLPAGTYRLDKTIYIGTKSRITLRGAGPEKTRLLLHAGASVFPAHALFPRLAPAGPRAEFVGVEDLTVDGTNANSQVGLGMTQGYGCWVKNVTVLNVNNYHLSIADSVQCEVRHCHLAKRKGEGSNGAGILVGTCSFCLFEDNLVVEQFPHIEVNRSSGNVFAYNFCHDSSIQGLLGCSIDGNHGPHGSFNLYEGNVSPKFQCDGYHGSASHDTAFRNWFHGTDDKTDQFWICVNLNRFTRDYSLAGNVLGRKGHAWLYEVEDVGFGYDKHFIYSLGFPNIGNGWSNGKTAQPSKGKYWADWDRMLASERGKGPSPNGFQELDLDVKATTLLKGNYNYKDRGVPESESLGGATLPKSLYLKEKPQWFGDLNWPPFGPDTDFEKNKIPVQVRFEAMKQVGR